MAIPSKEEILKEWMSRDPLVYQFYSLQQRDGLSDDEFWRMLVAAMADRHSHLERAHKKLLERTPPSPCVVMNV